MSLSKRLSLIFRAKANKVLDRAEDPRETLDYSYQRQLEMLQKVRRGLADVATSRKRIELQREQTAVSADKLQRQASEALSVGREDLAREALTRRSAAQQQLADLDQQQTALQAEQDKLTVASERLQAKVEAFRTRKETIKASYTAAEAETRIGEAVSGISEEMSDIGVAMQRAEDKTAQLQARAGAIDELLASGALEDASGGVKDDIQAQLDQLSSTADVDAQLAELKKAALPAGETGPAALDDRTEPDASRPPVAPADVIVRIMGEGQLRLPAARLDELNKLDDALADAVSADDEARFQRDLAVLLERVRAVGTPLANEDIAVSELILPGPGSTLAEVRALLGDEGLIPG